VTGPAAAAVPGQIRSPDREVVLSAGRPRLRLRVTGRSGRPVRVSSHYPFWQVNPRLEFDRAAAVGYRLDIPAGASVRWAPGEVKEVDLVASLVTGPPDMP
jgi:urease beta subunit